MKKHYSQSIVEEAFKNAGWDGICSEPIPVMLKRNFAIDSVTVLEAGTLCTIKAEYDTTEKGYIFAQLDLIFPYRTSGESLRCAINTNENTIAINEFVKTEYSAVSFNAIFEPCDKETGEKIKEYNNLRQSFCDAKQKYSDNSYVNSCLAGAGMIIMIIGMFIMAIHNHSNFGTFFGAIAVVLLITMVVFESKKYESTAKGKEKLKKLSALSEEILSKEAELAKQKGVRHL